MYLDYFSLDKHPFRITPDPSLFFPGGADGHGVVLDALVYAITSGEGILKVVGEVGSGKTMLCRMLEEKLPDSVEIVYLANPSIAAQDIVYAIAFELGLEVDAGTERLMVMHRLQQYLLERHAQGGTVVVFIEEAQSMPIESLEEVRLLSNLETHHHKLMQIVLFGQPELDRNLQQKRIRQLRERITHSFHLEPLAVDSGRDYLRHRLRAAGCPWPQLFTSRAERKLLRASKGLTRRINILADKALLASYADPATRPQPRDGRGQVQPMVLPRHVRAAIRDSGYRSRFVWLRPALAGLAVLLLISVGVLGVWRWQASGQADVVASGPPPGAGSGTQSPESLESRAGPEQPDSLGNTDRGEPEERVELARATTASPGQSGDNVEAPVPGAGPMSLPAERRPQPVPAARSQEAPAKPEAGTEESAAGATPSARPQSSESGLVAERIEASLDWQQSSGERQGYTVQLFSAAIDDPAVLEAYLGFLESAGLDDEARLCAISSGTRQEAATRLVLHGEYRGVTAARDFIGALPEYARRYGPFVRNLDDVACLRDPSLPPE